MSNGYIDLHCHYLPDVDDGVRTQQEGIALCQGLAKIGFTTVSATPHIRPGMFPNQADALLQSFKAFCVDTASVPDLPELALGAEHFFDMDVLDPQAIHMRLPYQRFSEEGELRRSTAILLELHPEMRPPHLDQILFGLIVQGTMPLLAHPERYIYSFSKNDWLEKLVNIGIKPILDLMALVGRYGEMPRRAAHSFLEQGFYFAACSDAHRPDDVESVDQGIKMLKTMVGIDECHRMLSIHPQSILDGDG